MKKLLLFLLILFSFSVNAQPPIVGPPFYSCDENNDGYAVFDLTMIIPTLLSAVNPQENTFTFHQSYTNAMEGIADISFPNAYTNIEPGTQLIFVRIVNNTTNEVNLFGVNLIADSANAGIGGSTTVCETSSTFIDLFGLITGEQPGGTWTRTSGSGGTFNAVAGTFIPSIGATPSTFSYTITPTPPCMSVSSVATVNVVPQPNAGIDGSITICDSEATSIDLYTLLTGENPGGVWSRAAGSGGTFNAVTGIYTPTTGATTSIFIYTIAGMAPCVNESSMVTVVVNSCNPQTCPPPSTFFVDSMTDTSVNLDWSTVPGAVSYQISVVPAGSAPNETNAISIQPVSNYILTGLQPQTCYSMYVRSRCSDNQFSSWSSALNVCLPDCTNTGDCSQGLVLMAFLDSNSNGIKDSGEGNFNYGNFVYQINDSGENQYGNSNAGSYYIFDRNPANSYDISFTVNNPLNAYYTSSATHNNITIPTGSGFNNLYFPVVNTAPYSDAAVQIIPTLQPRPGFTYSVILTYHNYGIQNIANGTLTFTKDPNVTISYNSQSGVTDTANGFTYGFTNLAAFETRQIHLNLSVPTIPTVNLNDLLVNSVSIEINDDINLSNNTSASSQVVVGSYDPNDKSEAHGGKIGIDDFSANDYLYYTIRFENTGTAATEFIKVIDVLDNQLDATSFEMIGTSHPVNTIRKGNEITWHFYDTQLPPTIVNPLDSHGYINFRIKPKAGFAVGDVIPNRASIYFDYNPPIITDFFNTEFFETLSTETFNEDTISMVPNPASSIVSLSNRNATEKISGISIYEVTGKRIFSLNNIQLDVVNIDVSQFSDGIYLVELSSDSNYRLIKKLVIQ